MDQPSPSGRAAQVRNRSDCLALGCDLDQSRTVDVVDLLRLAQNGLK
jgi:hypothetical protein